MKTKVSDVRFEIRFEFFAVIFSHSNELNCKLQGVDVNILELRDKVTTFIAKLKHWKTKIRPEQIVASYLMTKEMSENNGITSIIQSEVVERLNNLIKEFYHFFSDVIRHTFDGINTEPFQNFG